MAYLQLVQLVALRQMCLMETESVKLKWVWRKPRDSIYVSFALNCFCLQRSKNRHFTLLSKIFYLHCLCKLSLREIIFWQITTIFIPFYAFCVHLCPVALVKYGYNGMKRMKLIALSKQHGDFRACCHYSHFTYL